MGAATRKRTRRTSRQAVLALALQILGYSLASNQKPLERKRGNKRENERRKTLEERQGLRQMIEDCLKKDPGTDHWDR